MRGTQRSYLVLLAAERSSAVRMGALERAGISIHSCYEKMGQKEGPLNAQSVEKKYTRGFQKEILIANVD